MQPFGAEIVETGGLPPRTTAVGISDFPVALANVKCESGPVVH
jgi:hypothetical protein